MLAISLSFFIVGITAKAWPPLFGPEFTFTNADLFKDFIKYKTNPTFFYDKLKTPSSKAALKEWKNELKILCKTTKDCRVKRTKDKHGVAYRVIYNDGFWFQISLDEAVIEVQSKPETLDNFEKLKNRINNDIFSLAEKLNLKPDWSAGGGHLNMGLASAFEKNPILFRNWLVDIANNPELFWGILGKDTSNAPTLTDLGEERIRAFYKIIQEFDQNPTDIMRLASRIKNEVYTFNPAGWNEKHYQNINLNSIIYTILEELQRVEIRAVRPQENFDVFLLQIRLLTRRLEYLKTLTDRLPLDVPTVRNESFVHLMKKFYIYLYEMGERFETYSPLIKERLYGYNDSLIEELVKLSNSTDNMSRSKHACAALFNQ